MNDDRYQELLRVRAAISAACGSWLQSERSRSRPATVFRPAW